MQEFRSAASRAGEVGAESQFTSLATRDRPGVHGGAETGTFTPRKGKKQKQKLRAENEDLQNMPVPHTAV